MEFNAWLKATGRSQTSLAKELGVPRQSVNQWALGQHAPNDTALATLVRLSGGEISLDSFAKKRGKPGRPKGSKTKRPDEG